jgi:CBS domain-containing protein
MTSLSTVKEHMEKEPVTFRPDMEVEEAVALLVKHNISRAPVIDEQGNLVGVLAEGDCLEAFLNKEYFDSPAAVVKDLMTSEIVTVDSDVDILKAAELFLRHKFYHLPVLEQGRFVGQISRRDVIRAILELRPKRGGT